MGNFFPLLFVLQLLITVESCVKVDILEEKINKLMALTEKHIQDLAAKEKRIQHLEQIISNKEEFCQTFTTNDADSKNDDEDVYNETLDKDQKTTSSDVSSPENVQTKLFSQKTQRNDNRVRHVRSIPGSNRTIAFYSYLSHTEKSPSQHHTVIFDFPEINEGNAYNKYNGVFTAPESGLFFFSWTIYTGAHSHIFSEIVKNNEVHGIAKVDKDSSPDDGSSTTNVIIAVNKGDIVFVRTHSRYSSNGDIKSLEYLRSSFCGFKLN